MSKKQLRPKPQRINCPVCNTEMNRLDEIEGKEIYTCNECNTNYHLLEGKLTEYDKQGNEIDLAYVKAEEVELEPEEIERAKAFDVYFDNKAKRKFIGIVDLQHEKGWMIMVNKQGKQILLNPDKINIIEEL